MLVMQKTGYERWPRAARTMARGIDAAVAAAREGDGEAFEQALQDLAHVDREQVGTLLADITRTLLERAHPDGLDSEDAEELLRRCVRSTAPWFQRLDTDALIRALTGALGIGDTGTVGGGDASDSSGSGTSDDRRDPDPAEDPEERPRPDPAAVLAHGILLVADLVSTLAVELAPIVDDALGEAMRAQTMELP